MTRLETGHGAVCITEFGKGFRVPSNVADKRSQAWSAETKPDWSRGPLSHARCDSPAMGPMALVAAALHLGFPAVLAGDDGGGARSPAPLSQTTTGETREIGAGSAEVGPGGAACDLTNCSISFRLSTTASMGTMNLNVARRDDRVRSGDDHGQGKVFAPSAGAVTPVLSQEGDTWSKSPEQLPEMPSTRTRAEDALNSTPGPAPLEHQSSLHAGGLLQEIGEQGCNQEERRTADSSQLQPVGRGQPSSPRPNPRRQYRRRQR